MDSVFFPSPVALLLHGRRWFLKKFGEADDPLPQMSSKRRSFLPFFSSLEKCLPMGYELFDHTGDLGVNIRSADLKGLFCEAAVALFDIISDLDLIEVREKREITVEGMDDEELLVAWLNELLYLHEVEGLLFRNFTVIEVGEGRLKGMAGGEPLRDEVHTIKTIVKAVTYYQLEVRKENGGWFARIILDI